MAYCKNITVAAAIGGIILGGFAIFSLRREFQVKHWTGESGQNAARNDYAKGRPRLLLVSIDSKEQMAGITQMAMSYIRNIPADAQLMALRCTSDVYCFVEAYNRTMARLLAFEHKSAAAC
jgi:hypothetical protein